MGNDWNLWLVRRIDEQPDIYLREIQAALKSELFAKALDEGFSGVGVMRPDAVPELAAAPLPYWLSLAITGCSMSQ